MVDNENSSGNNQATQGSGDRNRGRSRRRKRGKKSGSPEGGPARTPEKAAERAPAQGRGGERGPNQGRSGERGQSQPGQPGQSGPAGQKKRRSQGSKNKNSKSGGKKKTVAAEVKLAKPLPKPREHIIKKYDILFYDTFAAAHQDVETIKAATANCDQLNLVIRAEGNMDDPVLTQIEKLKIFAGTAWTTIHERRVEDGWYTEPR